MQFFQKHVKILFSDLIYYHTGPNHKSKLSPTLTLNSKTNGAYTVDTANFFQIIFSNKIGILFVLYYALEYLVMNKIVLIK